MTGPYFLPASISDVPHVAVALGFTARRRYIHSAIFYRCADESVRSIDFDLDGNIVSATPEEKDQLRFAWAIPRFDPQILKQVAGFCESVGKDPRKFLYSFAFNEKVELAPKGDTFTIEGGTEGFTCATFVLAIFHRLRKPLLNISTWYNEPGDEEWQRSTLDLMRRWRQRGWLHVSEEALNRRVEEIGCLRFAPDAVMGACRFGEHPTYCAYARHQGKIALDWLDQYHELLGG
jgi:hypothetical protein